MYICTALCTLAGTVPGSYPGTLPGQPEQTQGKLINIRILYSYERAIFPFTEGNYHFTNIPRVGMHEQFSSVNKKVAMVIDAMVGPIRVYHYKEAIHMPDSN